MFQRRRGVRSGLPDVLVIFRQRPIFPELKSRRGVSARAALMALEGVIFRRKWKPPRLKPWEGPFADPTRRLPQAPEVAGERAAARKRWRLRQANRTREIAKSAAERDGAAKKSSSFPSADPLAEHRSNPLPDRLW
jgi:hypothetical protein